MLSLIKYLSNLPDVDSNLKVSEDPSGMSMSFKATVGGQVKSWHGIWCQILFKLSQKVLCWLHLPIWHHLMVNQECTFHSSFSLGRDLEDRWSLDMVPYCQCGFKCLLGCESYLISNIKCVEFPRFFFLFEIISAYDEWVLWAVCNYLAVFYSFSLIW